MRQIALVTDLDNTLYDWVGFYVPAFRAMVGRLAAETGLAPDVLLADFQAVHRRHGTVEYSFAIEELPSLLARWPDGVPREVVDAGAEAFRAVKRARLAPYPGVAETLAALAQRGVRIVAYTEANAYQALDRLIQLGLHRSFCAVYATEDHAVPEGRRRSNIGSRLGKPIFRIPNGVRKPDPAVLRIIAGNLGIDVGDLVYAGDSRAKDVAMAQRAGAVDVWASYGAHRSPEDDALLARISHWTPEMVAREAGAAAARLTPGHTLTGFAEVAAIVDAAGARP